MKLFSAILLSLSFCWISCSEPKIPSVDHINLEIQSSDFYKDFASMDTNDVVASIEKMKQEYPNYWNFFIDTIALGTVGTDTNTTNIDGIKYFLTHKDYRSLMDTVVQAFPSTEKISADLLQTFKLIKLYDSSFDVPNHIYYAITGLSNMVVLGSKADVTVGLDFYLGPEYQPYFQIQIPDFLSRRFISSYIPINVAQAIFLDKYPFEAFGQDLLSMMMEQGKQQYFLSLVTPSTTDAMRLGFSEEQYKWCEENEPKIYNFFSTKEMLFSKDVHQVVRYVQDGPTASGMPPESPGNVGSYIGYKIIKAYVAATDCTLAELLNEKDSKKILQLSKYQP